MNLAQVLRPVQNRVAPMYGDNHAPISLKAKVKVTCNGRHYHGEGALWHVYTGTHVTPEGTRIQKQWYSIRETNGDGDVHFALTVPAGVAFQGLAEEVPRNALRSWRQRVFWVALIVLALDQVWAIGATITGEFDLGLPTWVVTSILTFVATSLLYIFYVFKYATMASQLDAACMNRKCDGLWHDCVPTNSPTVSLQDLSSVFGARYPPEWFERATVHDVANILEQLQTMARALDRTATTMEDQREIAVFETVASHPHRALGARPLDGPRVPPWVYIVGIVIIVSVVAVMLFA